MHIGFPFQISGSGTTRTVSRSGWLRGLIEQVLFTEPGERVNRPDFGTPLNRMIFAPITDETSTGIQAIVQGNLQRYLGEEIEIRDVTVTSQDSALMVTITFADRLTGDQYREKFRTSEL